MNRTLTPANHRSQKLLCSILLFTLASIACSLGLANEPAATQVPTIQANGGPSPRGGMFTTEVWLTPLILLPGVALLIVSTSARFSQLHTEFHRLVDRPDAHARILSRHLLKRSALFRNALVALYVSVGLFALGSLLGGVVNFWRPSSLWIVGGATMTGIGCLVYASAELTQEALICLRVVTDHAGRLQNLTDEKETLETMSHAVADEVA